MGNGHELCVAADSVGDTVPQADIREVCAQYEETELAFAMRVAAPTDPLTDPAWQGATQLAWVFSTFASTYGFPNGQLAVLTVDGTLRTVATLFDHRTPVCEGSFDFDGVWYRASFDPRCLELPTAVTFAGYAQFDTEPGDPEDFDSVHGDRLPEGDHAEEEGALAGPISSDGWVCPGVSNAELESAGFQDRLTIPPVHRLNVDCAAHHGIVAGYADNTYRPVHAVRRDQMASFVVRTLDSAGVVLPPPGEARFADVPAGSPHREAIHRLAAAGIVHGGPGGLSADVFGPDLRVRRDQMASFLVRAAEYASDTELAAHTQAFVDVPAGSVHFANVNTAAEHGLVRGHPDGTFRPAGSVRRDQTASFSVRLLGWAGGQVEVSVFFSDEARTDDPAEVFPFSRHVQRPAVLRGALEELLRGPTAEERGQGYWSWFSEDTEGMVRSVRIEDATAFVDFDDFSEIIPNASTSHGSAVLLAQLDATATQFRSVEDTIYSFEGDQQAFYEWLQLAGPQ